MEWSEIQKIIVESIAEYSSEYLNILQEKREIDSKTFLKRIPKNYRKVSNLNVRVYKLKEDVNNKLSMLQRFEQLQDYNIHIANENKIVGLYAEKVLTINKIKRLNDILKKMLRDLNNLKIITLD